MNAAAPHLDPHLPSPVLTPDLLFPLIRYPKVTGPVCVRGTTKDVRGWAKGSLRRCYGKLEHGEVSLPFCLKEGIFPAEGEQVVIAGVLGVNKNLSVELQGEVVGAWQHAELKEPVRLPSRRHPLMPLSQFVGSHALADLGFVTTKTGWDDICAAASISSIRDCPQKQVSFSDEADFLLGLEELISQGIKGVVIARGGGERLGAIGDSTVVTQKLIEMGLPFYSALGHATDLGLIDKHADQSFLTPTDLAHRLSAYIEADRAAVTDREAADAAEQERDEALSNLASRDMTIQGLKQACLDRDSKLAQLEAQLIRHSTAQKRLIVALAIAAAATLITILR